MSACRRYSSKETRKQPTRRKESDISEKELYRQKRQAELDAWQADIEKMKAKASEASPDAQIEINE